MKEEIEISLIIPVYNSEVCLHKLFLKVHEILLKTGKKFEIILIDDGSTDKSWSIIKQFKSENPNVTGIKLNKNYGQHNALLCGLNNCSGNFVVTMDDDLEQNPEDILVLYATLLKDSQDVIYGIPKKNRKTNAVRKFTTGVYKRISKIDNKTGGEGSSFRIFTKEINTQLIRHTGPMFFLDEMIIWYTDKIGFIEVDYSPSLKTQSTYNYSSLFGLSVQVLILSSIRPLIILRQVGIYIFLFSLMAAGYLIFRKLVFKVPLGYTSIMVTILLSTGIIIACLAVIGEYIGHLISLSNNKPSYYIKEKA